MRVITMTCALVSLSVSAASARAQEAVPDVSIAGDRTLDEAMHRYRELQPAAEVWQTPALAVNGAIAPAAAAGERRPPERPQALAQFSRAELDRGGWENPFLPSAAAGNPLRTQPIGEGTTGTADSAEVVSGDVLLARIVSIYTRVWLDRGGWENPFVPVSDYEAGNALLAVEIGEGATLVARR